MKESLVGVIIINIKLVLHLALPRTYFPVIISHVIYNMHSMYKLPILSFSLDPCFVSATLLNTAYSSLTQRIHHTIPVE